MKNSNVSRRKFITGLGIAAGAIAAGSAAKTVGAARGRGLGEAASAHAMGKGATLSATGKRPAFLMVFKELKTVKMLNRG